MLKKINSRILVFLILALAVFLRFYQLGANPPSLDWDEVSLGYNAYHLLETGSDEFATKWPLAIRSFDDYKPPMYTYLTIPLMAVLGPVDLAIRLPSAFLGALTVLVTYFLVKLLFKREDLALLSMFLLAISPWHLQFSRIAFEANVGLFWFVLGTWLLLKAVKEKSHWLIFSAFAFAFSLYSYHSYRLVIPLFLSGLAWYYRRALWEKRKASLMAIIIGGVMVLPLVSVFLGGALQARFSSVSIFSSSGLLDRSIIKIDEDALSGNPLLGSLIHNRRVVYSLAFLQGYLDHWRADFLFLRGDGQGRHHAAGMGMLYLWELPFLLAGIFFLGRKKGSFVIYWWFLVAPIASAISTGTPHPVRALLYLPTFQIFTAFGLLAVIKRVKFKKVFVVAVKLLIVLNGFYYLHQYYIHTPVDYAQDWQYGYKQAVTMVDQRFGDYDKIIVTNFYDQPYVFFLFYHQPKPILAKNDGRFDLGFDKFEFRRINWEEDKNLNNALLVGTEGEIPGESSRVIDQIYFPDGRVAFRLAETLR